MRHHLLADLPRQNELRAQIGFDDLVPIFVGMLGGGLAQNRPGVVEKNVNLREILFDLPDEGVEGFAVGKVRRVTLERPPQRADLLFDLAAGRLQACAHADDVRARLRQAHSDGPSDAAFAARDQGRFSVQLELFEDVHIPRVCKTGAINQDNPLECRAGL